MRANTRLGRPMRRKRAHHRSPVLQRARLRPGEDHLEPAALALLWIGGGLAASLAVGGIGYLALQSHRRRWENWVAAGKDFGLERVKRAWFRSDALVGTDRGIDLVADTYTESHGESSTTYTRVTAAHPDLPPDLQVDRESLLGGLAKRLWKGEDVQLGDPAFDGQLLLRGPEDHLLAALGQSTRAEVLARMDEPRATANKGQVLVVKAGVVREQAELSAWIRTARDQALALAVPRHEIPLRLGAHVREDPVPGFRVRSLEALATSHRDHPAFAAALAAALTDPAPEVRLAAAWHKTPRTLDWPAPVGGEAAILPLLGSALEVVVILACEALREVGSVQAVLPLRSLLAETKSPAVKAVAREALNTVQGRLGGAEVQGGLAVLDAPGGSSGGLAVSEAEPSGGLSVQESLEAEGTGPGGRPQPEKA